MAQSNGGGVNIAVPIDIPFTEVSRLLGTQFVGKTFPQDGSGAFAATVKAASVAASGDRLLISQIAAAVGGFAARAPGLSAKERSPICG